MRSLVNLKQRTHLGAVTESGEIILQRRGCSPTLEAGANGNWYEINRWHDDSKTSLTVSGEDGQVSLRKTYGGKKLDGAIMDIEAVSRLKVSGQIAAYMFAFSLSEYDYQKDDLILTGASYCEATDTIRTPENYCLVRFEDPKSVDPYDLEMDGATRDFRDVAARILESRMSCYTEKRDKKPIDHIKRRMAWLIGESLTKSRLIACWCKPDMTRA